MPVSVRGEQLDFLRGLAATYVLANHARGAFYVGGEALLSNNPSIADYLAVAVLQLTSLGAEMVILFFVLSGFAMAHSVAHSNGLGRFYAKRFIRIWPPYLVATLFAAAVGLLVGERVPLTVALYISPSTELTPQFWSLPYEVLFYALCPFILRKGLFPVAVMATIVTVALRGPMLNPWPSTIVNFFGNELLMFAAGAAAFRYFERIPELSPRVLILVTGLSCAAVWALKYLLGGTNVFGNLIVIGFALLAVRNLPRKMPFNFGFFSYSIYIYSYALIALLVWLVSPIADASSITNPFAWIVVVPPVLLASYALYWIVERPCNALVARIRGTTLSSENELLADDQPSPADAVPPPREAR